MSWYIAPALAQLLTEVNAAWPNRSKVSDGGIGDAAHSSRTSDHNPNSRGSVNAYDFTASGITTAALIAAAKKHPSVRYIIFNRQIMNRDIGNFRARPYSGANPHTTHVHISLYQSRTAEQRTQKWGIAVTGGTPSKPAPPKRPGTTAPPWPYGPKDHLGPEGGDNHSKSGYHSAKDRKNVRRYQQRMKDRGWSRMMVDGYFGKRGQTDPLASITGDLTAQFQREKGLPADGLPGPVTWAAAWEEPVT